MRNVLTTCFIYCGPFFLTFCFNNTVAWTHRVRARSVQLLVTCLGTCQHTATGLGKTWIATG